MKENFEEFSEYIYISDLNNYDLLYLNSFLFDSLNIVEYKNKKCYEVLYNRSSPCEFCKNNKINKEDFLVWKNENIFLNKEDTITWEKEIYWDEKKAKISLSSDLPIKNLENANLNLHVIEALEIKELTLKSVEMLYTSENPKRAIKDILEMVGKFLRASKIYINEYKIGKKEIFNSYSWKDENTNLEMLKEDNIEIIKELKNIKEIVFINSLSKEVSEKSKNNLKKSNVDLLIVYPLIIHDKVWGYIFIENPEKNKKQIESLIEAIAHFINNGVEQMRITEMLIHLCYFDMLTNLRNRNQFMDDLRELSKLKLDSVGVVYIDINSLNMLNDLKGHSYGDRVLLESAKTIKRFFDERYSYRIGGDEFVILVLNKSEDNFKELVQSLKNSFLIKKEFTASIGWQWENEPDDLDRLINNADGMMFEEKKNHYRYNPITNRYRKVMDNIFAFSDEKYLLNSLKQNRFKVYYQPKISFKTRKLIGSEALIRYFDEKDNMISPDQFLPVLEEAKLTYHLDYFVFETACKQIYTWIKKCYPVHSMSINFSRYTLLREDFMENIIGIWSKYKIDKKLIEIEITESVGDVSGKDMLKTLKEIRKEGFHLSIDDFGMKYSNLSLFSAIEFDVLKIDRTMLSDLTTDSKSLILLKGIVEICKNMNIELIVEGVETENQFEILKSLHCHGAQGYLFSRPLPIEKFEYNLLNKEIY